MQRIIPLTLLIMASCTQIVDDGEVECTCLFDTKCDPATACGGPEDDGEDEVGIDGCGRARTERGVFGPPESGCDASWAARVNEAGSEVVDVDASLDWCDVPPVGFYCFSGTHWVGEPPVCYYCADWDQRLWDAGVDPYTEITPVSIGTSPNAPGAIAVPAINAWPDWTLVGAIAPLDGDRMNARPDLMPPPLGELEGYYSSALACWNGRSCLDLGDTCSCIVRAPNGLYYDTPEWLEDYFYPFSDPWAYNREPTASGEPLVYDYDAASWVGSTLELDGPPEGLQDPPNGADTTVPGLLAAGAAECTQGSCVVSPALVAAGVQSPISLLGGASVRFVDGDAVFDRCLSRAPCGLLGIVPGDRVPLDSASAALAAFMLSGAASIPIIDESGSARWAFVRLQD